MRTTQQILEQDRKEARQAAFKLKREILRENDPVKLYRLAASLKRLLAEGYRIPGADEDEPEHE